MQTSFLFALLICLFCSTPLFAQKNEAAIDLRITPGENSLYYGASLNYFRNITTRHQCGFQRFLKNTHRSERFLQLVLYSERRCRPAIFQSRTEHFVFILNLRTT